MSQIPEKRPKTFPGAIRYAGRLVMPQRKTYSPAMDMTIELYEGRNIEKTFECSNIAEVAKKIQAYLTEKMGYSLQERMLARWFLEYFNEIGIKQPELHELLEDFRSSPEEIAAREGEKKAEPEEEEEEEKEAEEKVAAEPEPEEEKGEVREIKIDYKERTYTFESDITEDELKSKRGIPREVKEELAEKLGYDY
ncbi:MAG: hypothetical protein GF308_04695 [Candidatus Heimdallarchaeota archaeon]|nr:hypothetical protein [Candidatus Heimdallarchaeota archaeon]